MSRRRDQVKGVMRELLVAGGWHLGKRSDGTPFVDREVPTAVGDKYAYVQLWESADSMLLLPHYQSEARNVLITCNAYFYDDESEQITQQKMAKFIRDTDQAIDQSYARNLYLLGHRNLHRWQPEPESEFVPAPGM